MYRKCSRRRAWLFDFPSVSSLDYAAKNSLTFIPSVGPGYVDTRVRPWNYKNTRWVLMFEAIFKHLNRNLYLPVLISHGETFISGIVEKECTTRLPGVQPSPPLPNTFQSPVSTNGTRSADFQFELLVVASCCVL